MSRVSEVPVGLLVARRRTGLTPLLGLFVGVALLPLLVGLAAITMSDLVALAVGVGVGALVPEGAAVSKCRSEPAMHG